METLRNVLSRAEEEFARAGIPNSRRNAEWMMCEVLEGSIAALYARLDDPISPQTAEHFRSMVSRRLQHEPLQYILGYADFFGLRVHVNRDVLIPRPETEQVVEEALERIGNSTSPRVLDVGTGSGCIALAIRANRSDAAVWASDISAPALTVARRNAKRLELSVEFMQLDLRADEFIERAPADLDLLISNPPYVSEDEAGELSAEVHDYEPHIALFAPQEPLIYYRKLGEHGTRLLVPGGHLVLETHAEHATEAEDVLRSYGYEEVRLKRDYAGRPRILSARRPSAARQNRSSKAR